ncbi:unnamed protein product [Orchesella dallaii]|uniref:Uncharacterized protein n=1 Tax=Orchesella dallaii TaxID=48710 RepID=A0ABP1PNJ9_9HEXA
MKSYTFSVPIILFAAALFQGAVSTNIKWNFGELTSIERVLLLSSHPDLYHKFAKNSQESKLSVNSDHELRDLITYDILTLTLQLAKSDGVILPTARRTYVRYFCYLGICSGYQQDFEYKEPEIRNANLSRLDTKVNATNIDIHFQIPDFQIVNEKYLLTDILINGDIEVTRGLTFS